MNLIRRLKSRALRWAQPFPFQCRHIEYSTISSLDDQIGVPTERLINASLQAITAAKDIDLSGLSTRIQTGSLFLNIWPGEHYKLLAGFMASQRPRKVIEIGTFQGHSALAMLSQLPQSSKLITVDIVPWREIDSSILRESDFSDGRLTQAIGDLSSKAFFDYFTSELLDCDFLFVDGPKNVIFEQTLLRFMETVSLLPQLLVVFDDIRVWNMLSIWRTIKQPKLDLTSFGHWSGTGIVDWNGRAVPRS